MSGGPPCDRPNVSSQRLWIALLNTFESFSQGLDDNMRHRLAGGLRNGTGETMGFRVFYVEAH